MPFLIFVIHFVWIFTFVILEYRYYISSSYICFIYLNSISIARWLTLQGQKLLHLFLLYIILFTVLDKDRLLIVKTLVNLSYSFRIFRDLKYKSNSLQMFIPFLWWFNLNALALNISMNINHGKHYQETIRNEIQVWRRNNYVHIWLIIWILQFCVICFLYRTCLSF